MGKLKVLGSVIPKMAPRIPTLRDVRDTKAGAGTAMRGWYKSKRWAKLREEVLARDLYTCRQTGVLLTGKSPAPNSPVVDHIEPHRGNEALFWDKSNLQTVAKSWHDGEKQRQERRGYENTEPAGRS